jgi:hypothetical protein
VTIAGCRYQVYIEAATGWRRGEQAEPLWNWRLLTEAGHVTARGHGYRSLDRCYRAIRRREAAQGELPIEIDLLHTGAQRTTGAAMPFRNIH